MIKLFFCQMLCWKGNCSWKFRNERMKKYFGWSDVGSLNMSFGFKWVMNQTFSYKNSFKFFEIWYFYSFSARPLVNPLRKVSYTPVVNNNEYEKKKYSPTCRLKFSWIKWESGNTRISNQDDNLTIEGIKFFFLRFTEMWGGLRLRVMDDLVKISSFRGWKRVTVNNSFPTGVENSLSIFKLIISVIEIPSVFYSKIS